MQRYSTRGYFNDVKDMLIFLIPAGILSCIIAPTIGVTALYIYGAVLPSHLIYVWATFWIGDVMGVYVITPLVLIWTMYKSRVPVMEQCAQTCMMFVVFVVISWLNCTHGNMLQFLFVPFILWVTYRLLLHGSTIFCLFISLFVIATSLRSYGSIVGAITNDQLAVLVLFVEVLVATSLVFAGIIRERESILRSLQRQNIDLRQSVEVHVQELADMDHAISMQGTVGSLGFLTSHIARQLQIPLKALANFTKGSLECLNRLKNEILPNSSKLVQDDVKLLEDYLGNIVIFEDQALGLAHLVQEQSSLVVVGRNKQDAVGLNDLLDRCLGKVVREAAQAHPDFAFTSTKNYDSGIEMVFPLPEDLSPAFIPLLNNAINSMLVKKDESYNPQLEVSTKDCVDTVDIVIRDNGLGIAQGEIQSLFRSFMSAIPPSSSKGMSLALAHDLVVYVYHGTIKVDSKEGEYTQFTISLPKKK